MTHNMKINPSLVSDSTSLLSKSKSPGSFHSGRSSCSVFTTQTSPFPPFSRKEDVLLSLLMAVGFQVDREAAAVPEVLLQWFNSDGVGSHWKLRAHSSICFEGRTLVISHGCSPWEHIKGEKSRTSQTNLGWHLFKICQALFIWSILLQALALPDH